MSDLWSCSWIKNEKLGGMRFRLPVHKEWAGKAVESYADLS